MNKSLVVSSCILALSISFAAIVTSHSDRQLLGTESDSILTEKEIVAYLHITHNDLQKIMLDDQSKKQEFQKNNGAWDTYMFLPYAIIGETKVFLKEEVYKWLEYHSHNVKQ